MLKAMYIHKYTRLGVGSHATLPDMNEYYQKFFIYARKSTDDKDRQVQSIPDQVAELREYAQNNDIHVIQVLTEKQSAKKTGRKIFDTMLANIAKGEAHGILAWSPDRLARNVMDGARLIEMIEKHNAHLYFPTHTFDNTPYGLFCLSLAFGQSKLYIDNLSQSVKRGMRQKAKRGIYPTRAPIGYLNDRIHKTIVPDPEYAPIVRSLFEKYATNNYAFDELRFPMKNNKLCSLSHVNRILKNTLYYGMFVWNNEAHEGAHKPIITKKLFDTCQQVMEQRGKPQKKPIAKQHAYRNLLVCAGCGCSITSSTQKGYLYYHCTKKRGKCNGKYIRAEKIDEEISLTLQKVSLAPKYAENLTQEIYGIYTQEKATGANRTETLSQQIKACEQQLDTLLDTFLTGDITREEYVNKKKDLLNKKVSLQEKLESVSCDGSDWLEPALSFVKQAKSARNIALSTNLTEKANLFCEVGLNRKLDQFSVKHEPRGAWDVLEQQRERSEHRCIKDTKKSTLKEHLPLGAADGS